MGASAVGPATRGSGTKGGGALRASGRRGVAGGRPAAGRPPPRPSRRRVRPPGLERDARAAAATAKTATIAADTFLSYETYDKAADLYTLALTKPGVDAVKKFTRIYPLAQAGNPPPALKFVNMSGKPFNMVAPADASFWSMLHQARRCCRTLP